MSRAPQFFGDRVERTAFADDACFAASVASSRAHVAAHPYDHHEGGGPRPCCAHPFVEGWDLQRCASCAADLGAERAAAEARAADAAAREDAERSAADGGGGDHATRLRAWGVRIDWLIAFTYAHGCWEWPTWRVVRDIVKPATRADRNRYSQLSDVAPHAGAATVFMSHCWGASWGTLVLAAANGARVDRVVWIDCFAVRQWPGNAADLGT